MTAGVQVLLETIDASIASEEDERGGKGWGRDWQSGIWRDEGSRNRRCDRLKRDDRRKRCWQRSASACSWTKQQLLGWVKLLKSSSYEEASPNTADGGCNSLESDTFLSGSILSSYSSCFLSSHSYSASSFFLSHFLSFSSHSYSSSPLPPPHPPPLPPCRLSN